MRPSLTIVVSVTSDANNFSSKSERSVVFRFRVEVGRYIENIVDIDISVSYRHFRYWLFRYIDIVSMTSEISVIFPGQFPLPFYMV